MNETATRTILIIEDEPGFRHIYRDLLEREGFLFLEAEDGEKGWALARDAKPDLVLLDLVLPKESGYEVLKRIRHNDATREIPVIVFTVMSDDQDIDIGIELGANDYLVKGYDRPEVIVHRIKALIG